jgi:uncharacterized tellurite resistance protein B-like protein
MIAGIRDFFNRIIAPGAAQPGAASQHALQVATAALLLEMMRMDSSITAAEAASVTRTLQTRFGLDSAQVDRLMALAAEEARLATDYFQFTSLINRSFSAEQKVQVVEYLWQVAYADGHLDAHEQHFMRKIADLLYVSHADYVGAKQRARDANPATP